MCAEIDARRKGQWYSEEERQRTWSQENQENRNKAGYSRPYDKWMREDNTKNRTYRDTSGSNRGTETSTEETKRSKFGESSQHSRPTAVAKEGYTQIVVNPMQLEDEAFTTWMQRLTEARRNREKRVQRPYRNLNKDRR